VSVALVTQDEVRKHHTVFSSVVWFCLPHSLSFFHETTRFMLEDFFPYCVFSFLSTKLKHCHYVNYPICVRYFIQIQTFSTDFLISPIISIEGICVVRRWVVGWPKAKHKETTTSFTFLGFAKIEYGPPLGVYALVCLVAVKVICETETCRTLVYI